MLQPPCETWTIARFAGDDGPQPLRSPEAQWGLPGQGARSIRQLDVGNVLLLIAFTFLMAAVCTGSCAMLEHPAFLDRHVELNAPSIWRFEIFAKLDALEFCKRHLIFQGKFGAVAWKPTNFYGVHMDNFEQVASSYERIPEPGELITLIGKNEEGGYKTAAAKEYPPQMCRVIAETACAKISAAARSQTPQDDELVAELRKFYVALLEGQDRGGDFGADFWDDAAADAAIFTYRLPKQ
jgi:hypothetical protein